MFKRLKTISALVLCCSIMLATISSAAFLQPAVVRAEGSTAPCEIQWKAVKVPNIGGLISVTALSENDVWALGSDEFLHWNGSGWSKQPTALDYSDFVTVRSLAPKQLISVGVDIEGDSLNSGAWAWNGSQWRYMAGSRMGADIAGFADVAILSRLNMWAVGYTYVDAYGPLLAHWIKNKGKQVTPPAITAPANLKVIDAISKHDIWAAGTYGQAPRRVWLVHRDANAWTSVAAPAPSNPTANADPNAIVALAANDVWVFGEQDPDRTAMALHWDGDSWQFVDTGLEVNHPLLGAAAAAPDNLWIVGDTRIDLNRPLLVHWDGATWTKAVAYHGTHVIPNAYLEDVIAINQNLWWAVGARGQGKSLVLKGTCAP